MSRIKALVVSFFALFTVVVLLGTDQVAIPVSSLSSGPPAGHSGAPGEATCILCHSGGGGGGGQFAILSAPANYVPGQTYQLQVRHINDDPSRMRWGFQMTALDETNLAAGTFENLSMMTQILTANGRSYIEHTAAGTAEGQPGGQQWTLNWTAPPTNVGAITFYAAGNQADGDGTNEGDQIRTARVTSAASAGTPTPTNTPTSTPTATPTSTPTATPTATPTPQGFEADIAPRPSGDGSFLSSDVVQIRRFVVGLEQPNTATNEYQRTDSAPSATRGNGFLDAADTVQTRRYVAGLDAPQAPGGPTSPVTAPDDAGSLLNYAWQYFFGYEVKLLDAVVDRGNTVTMLVESSALDGVAGLSFTMDFDPLALKNPTIQLAGDQVSMSVITVNDTYLQEGHLGVLVDSSGTIGQLLVTFEVVDSFGIGETRVGFSDRVAVRSISDSFGSSAPVKFSSGVVTIK
jgi:hypothetical protein